MDSCTAALGSLHSDRPEAIAEGLEYLSACLESLPEALHSASEAGASCVAALAAFLLHRGLPTLPLRVKAAQDGARMLVERLARHPKVARVHYPGLPGADPQGLVGRQMAGPGSVLAFELSGGFEAAGRVLDAVKIMVSAVSLGTTDTLIQHPAGLTHRCTSEMAKESTGISESLLRVSVGLEDPEDLWAGLEQVLDAAHAELGTASPEPPKAAASPRPPA